jgi:hypothetical protein
LCFWEINATTKQWLIFFREIAPSDGDYLKAVGRVFRRGRSQDNVGRNAKKLVQNLKSMVSGFAGTDGYEDELLRDIREELQLDKLDFDHPAFGKIVLDNLVDSIQ